MTETSFQWKVTWFPPDIAERSTTTADEAKARATARRHRECFPIIERRTVEVGDWVIIETEQPEPDDDEDFGLDDPAHIRKEKP